MNPNYLVGMAAFALMSGGIALSKAPSDEELAQMERDRLKAIADKARSQPLCRRRRSETKTQSRKTKAPRKPAMSQEENKLSDRALAKKLGALAAHFEAACYVGDTYMVEENAADASVLRQAEAALYRRASAGGEAGVPADARLRMYYPIVMPLNSDGIGPASEKLGEIRKLTWEVWDQFCDTFGSFDCLTDAIMEAERLNREHYSALHPKAVSAKAVTGAMVDAGAHVLEDRFGMGQPWEELCEIADAVISAAQGVE